MSVYLLHFSEPMPRDRRDGPRPVSHYLGFADHVARRVAHHEAGTGARITAAAAARGIRFTIARTWSGGRTLERSLKRRAQHSALCPVCRSVGRHKAVARPCEGCGRPVCRACLVHLAYCRAGSPRAYYRHTKRTGCR